MSERHSKLSVSNMIEGECQECEEHTCYIWTAERKKKNFYTHTCPPHLNTNVLWLSTTLMARTALSFRLHRIKLALLSYCQQMSHKTNNVYDTFHQGTSSPLKTEIVKMFFYFIFKKINNFLE